MLKMIHRFISVLLLLICVVSCSNSKISKIIQNTSVIQIELYGCKDGHITTVKTIDITDRNSISQLSECLSNSNAPMYKAGYHGKINLYDQNNKLLIKDGIEFNIYPDCKHYIYIINGKLYSKKLSTFGFKYLNSLYNELPLDLKL